MITVNTNMASLIAQNSFNRASNSMNNALNRLSTGYRINSAKDDAAGSAIAAKLETKISSYAQATKNAEMGADYLQSADSTLSTMQSMVQRMRDLTEQAANGTYGADERKAIQAEIDGLTAELYRIKNTTEFNGKKIFGEENTSIITEADAKAQGYIVVKTAQELKDALKSDDPNCKVMLFSNIDLNDLPTNATGSNWTPVDKFKGVLDGNGYTIGNLKIDATNNEGDAKDTIGFFSRLIGAKIKNLNINNADVRGRNNVGILAGRAEIGSKIENISVSGFSKGNNYVAGFIGVLSNVEIDSCEVYGSTEAVNHGAIFTAENQGTSVIKNSYARNFNVSSSNQIAGAIGYLWKGNLTLENCVLDNCSLNSDKKNAGVFLGYLNPSLDGEVDLIIKDCKSTSTVNAIKDTLGVVIGGVNANANADDSVTVSNLEYKPQFVGGEEVKMIGSDIPAKMPTPVIDAIKNPNLTVSRPKKYYTQPEPTETEVNLQVGIQADKNSTIQINTGFTIGEFKISVFDVIDAQNSLTRIDALMDTIMAKKTDIGASLNRLESVMAQQQTMRTSMTSALSQIKDADIARESAIYVKNQILQQTTASLLATANQNPNIALNLL